jgi:glycerophosphoryl diester phosphodiesterase
VTESGSISCFHGGVASRLASPDVIAHRGASAYAREHSFEAYDLALSQGADMLELDVRAAADGGLVVLHDPTLLRIADDPRHIGSVSTTALEAIDTAVRPQTLDAVLDRYGATTRWLVELKEPAAEWETRVTDALVRRGLDGHAVVQSFDPDGLERMHAACPTLEVAPLYRQTPTDEELERAADFAAGVGVRHTAVDADLIARAGARGLAVRAWTVNAPDAIERLLDVGVDGVITDVPDVARRIVDAAPVSAAA